MVCSAHVEEAHVWFEVEEAHSLYHHCHAAKKTLTIQNFFLSNMLHAETAAAAAAR